MVIYYIFVCIASQEIYRLLVMFSQSWFELYVKRLWLEIENGSDFKITW